MGSASSSLGLVSHPMALAPAGSAPPRVPLHHRALGEPRPFEGAPPLCDGPTGNWRRRCSHFRFRGGGCGAERDLAPPPLLTEPPLRLVLPGRCGRGPEAAAAAAR
jgi:hypothetical protein